MESHVGAQPDQWLAAWMHGPKAGDQPHKPINNLTAPGQPQLKPRVGVQPNQWLPLRTDPKWVIGSQPRPKAEISHTNRSMAWLRAGNHIQKHRF